ncbi:MAG: heme-binding domain-containing protein [Chitinophagaceae bacterium]|nr:heme-binding domain-containing protein [Chitinophagaceae bacterium]
MFKKILKRTLLVLLLAFVVIQFFRPAKNKAEGISNNDITKLYPVPQDVQDILKTSCYDCHSNNTVYPWYAEVQPVTWWLDKHIQDGKKDLNFSEFAGYRLRRQYKKLEEINELVKKNEMPLDSYLWIHKNAKLSDAQKLTLANWVTAVRDTMKATYPMDSLVRKKQS